MADVHHHALELHSGGELAVEFARRSQGVEEAVAHAGAVEHCGLGAGQKALALQGGEVAPDVGGEHVPGEVFGGEALEDGGALVLGGSLGGFEFLLRFFQARLQGVELGFAHALHAEA